LTNREGFGVIDKNIRILVEHSLGCKARDAEEAHHASLPLFFFKEEKHGFLLKFSVDKEGPRR
jgi:hypothetical protein